MPLNHRQYAKWNGERFRQWASKVGPQTACVVDALLTCHKVEQQGYRSCMALLNLSDRYSPLRLEAACTKALQYSFNPSFKSVEAMLKSGRDKIVEEKPSASNSAFGLTRGADYYGKEQD